MTASRGAAWIALAFLVVVFAILLWRLVPWEFLGTGSQGARSAGEDFSAEEIAQSAHFHGILRRLQLGSTLVALVVPLVLGLTPLGSRLIETVARPLGGGWVWQALLGGLLLVFLSHACLLPFRAGIHALRHHYGLSVQTWGAWAQDVAKVWALAAVITAALFVGFFALTRAMPQWWWAPVSVAVVGIVFMLSFLYPLIISPLFTSYSPMPASSLKSELLDMARKDGVAVNDVMVADASRRTTAFNAYVMGFGASRRIVVYDTLLEQAQPEQVKLAVAHELAHAKYKDVLVGTLFTAAGAAIGVIAGFLLLTWKVLLARAGVESVQDPRSAGLILALIAIASLLTLPMQNGIARLVEARADQHSLDLTGDPSTFIESFRNLATKNISELEPSPLLHAIFNSHPSVIQRIGHAREYGQEVAPAQ